MKKSLLNFLFCLPQILWLKLRYRNKFSCSYVQLWTGRVELNIRKNSSITIGRKLHQRGNLYLISDENGNISIGNNVFANYNVSITSLSSIIIENFVTIANNVVIVDHDHDLSKESRSGFICKPVRIKMGAWIGANAVILKGVTVGRNAVVAAGAVVTKSIPDNEMWGGCPARFIKRIDV